METVNLKSSPEVHRVITAAFPGYKKHNAFLSAFSDCGVEINSYWDGGSKSVFVLVDLATLARKALPTSSHPYFDMHAASGQTPDVIVDRGNVTLTQLPEGVVLIEGGTFCGKTATAHVHVNPANLTKFLGGKQ
jgi:hypothetical protein